MLSLSHNIAFSTATALTEAEYESKFKLTKKVVSFVSLLNLYTMVSMGDVSYALIQMKSMKM